MPEIAILVVEDDSAILDTIADVLRFEGYLVLTAVNGDAALSVIEEQRPALVLLDMRLPVLDGWETIRMLRAGGSTVPIVAMTATPNAQSWAETIGVQGLLVKPFDLEELLAVVGRVLREAA